MSYSQRLNVESILLKMRPLTGIVAVACLGGTAGYANFLDDGNRTASTSALTVTVSTSSPGKLDCHEANDQSCYGLAEPPVQGPVQPLGIDASTSNALLESGDFVDYDYFFDKALPRVDAVTYRLEPPLSYGRPLRRPDGTETDPIDAIVSTEPEPVLVAALAVDSTSVILDDQESPIPGLLDNPAGDGVAGLDPETESDLQQATGLPEVKSEVWTAFRFEDYLGYDDPEPFAYAGDDIPGITQLASKLRSGSVVLDQQPEWVDLTEGAESEFMEFNLDVVFDDSGSEEILPGHPYGHWLGDERWTSVSRIYVTYSTPPAPNAPAHEGQEPLIDVVFADLPFDGIASQLPQSSLPGADPMLTSAGLPVARPKLKVPEQAREPLTARRPETLLLRSNSPSIKRTSSSIVRQATVSMSADPSKPALVGVYSRNNRRNALVRMPNGSIMRVTRGSRFEGGKISSITANSLVYVREGEQYTLNIR